LWEKSGKFSKNLSWLDLHNYEFSLVYLDARSCSSNTSVKANWFENKNGVWIWNSNHTTLIIQTKSNKDFIQASKLQSETLFKHCSYYSDTRGVTALPPNRNIIPRFGGRGGPNRNNEQLHISSLWKHKVWMARMKKVLAFPSCFLFSIVAPLYLEELDYFPLCDTILLIQDFDWVLGVRWVSLKRCHFRQHDIHRCLQTFL
jgi:hypothetical protein